MKVLRAVGRALSRVELWIRRPTVERRVLWVLFLAATALRLWFVLWEHPPGKHVTSDMWVYDMRAHRVMEGTFDLGDTFQPLGYPAMLALLYSISDTSQTLVGVVQALMGGLTVVFTYRIAQRVGSSSLLGLFAALAVGVHLPLIVYTGLLLTEVPFCFAVTLALWLILRALEERTFGSAVWAGVALGVATVVRSNLMAFFPLLPLFLSWALRGEKKRRAWILCGQLVLGALIPISAAVIHNSIRSKRPVGLATNGGANFYLNFAEIRTLKSVSQAGEHHITPIPNLIRYDKDEIHRTALYNEQYFYQRGFKLLREKPSRLVRALDNLVEGAGAGKQDYWPGWPWHDRLLAGHAKVFFWLGVLPAMLHILWLFASGRFLRPEAAPRVLLALALSSAILTLYLFLGDPRMRVPFDPVLIVLTLDAPRRLFKWIGWRVQASLSRRAAAVAPAAAPPPAAPPLAEPPLPTAEPSP